MPRQTISIVEFFNKQTEIYKAPLLGQFDVVTLSANSYVDFAGRECRIEYYRENYYKSYIEINLPTLPDIAKQIDNDVKIYWNASLDETLKKHDFLCKEYNDRTRRYKRKSLYELFGAPNAARLGMTKKDLQEAFSRLPNNEFTDASHVRNWRSSAGICAQVLTDTYDTHSEIVDKIRDIDRARYERICARVGVLSGLLSPAVSLAKMFLCVPS